jgi:hypothetical protein
MQNRNDVAPLTGVTAMKVFAQLFERSQSLLAAK